MAPKNFSPKWGRYNDGNWTSVFLTSLIVLFCPLMVVYFWHTCSFYKGCLSCPLIALYTSSDPVNLLKSWLPIPTREGFLLYFAWVLFQAILYATIPAKMGHGQVTPSGEKLLYKVNGLKAYVLSHVLFIALSYLDVISPTIIHDNWGAILVATNVYANILAIFVFLKAYISPSHPKDRKFSGSLWYDFYMGIELNPRFGKLWDFKLFHNGRPGIIGWTLINLSFSAAQYKLYGTVSNSMILVNLFHFLYVIDFFWNEDWYLRTIDIAHDHFGWMLSFGDSVWLPFMYTLQAQYLVHNPVQLSMKNAIGIFLLGSVGYWIFRNVNNQKNLVRLTNGNCLIWGKKPKVIRAKYTSIDGKSHESLLLCSGFWGFSRHFNYVGDLMLSLAMCLACGWDNLLPYFYIVYMTILLVHRIYRDDTRCRGKYGQYWDEYCKVVRYKLVPFIY